MKDYYKILQISPQANNEQIKRSFRALAKTYHPDKNKSEDAEQKFKMINEAYQVLSDPATRERYDQYLLSFVAQTIFHYQQNQQSQQAQQSKTKTHSPPVKIKARTSLYYLFTYLRIISTAILLLLIILFIFPLLEIMYSSARASYHYKQALALIENNDYDLAHRHLNKAFTYSPHDPDINFQQAEMVVARKEPLVHLGKYLDRAKGSSVRQMSRVNYLYAIYHVDKKDLGKAYEYALQTEEKDTLMLYVLAMQEKDEIQRVVYAKKYFEADGQQADVLITYLAVLEAQNAVLAISEEVGKLADSPLKSYYQAIVSLQIEKDTLNACQHFLNAHMAHFEKAEAYLMELCWK